MNGKTALVAGASRGIGLAIARAMAEAGARTVLAARSMEALEKHAAELRAKGLLAEARHLDFTRPETIQALAGEWGSETGILVNVAGMNIRKQAEKFTREEYDRLLQTNLHGIFELTQLMGAAMIARGQGGKIINIGSETSHLGLPYVSVYGISKAGIAGLTFALAAEWGRYNIQVNGIIPGFIITDLNRVMWQSETLRAWLRGVQANPEPGVPEDVAPVAVFLASSASDYVTGQMIAVDGGLSTTLVWPFQP